METQRPVPLSGGRQRHVATTATELVRWSQRNQQQPRKLRKVETSTTTGSTPKTLRPQQPAPRKRTTGTTVIEGVEDIDREIARLEAELATDYSDTSSSCASTADDDGRYAAKNESNGLQPHNDEGILCLSTLKNERIERLPSKHLPKIVASKNSNTEAARQKKRTAVQSSGLEKAVQEVLRGYVPRSAERLPFYCRVCQTQFSNEDEFFEHRQSQFHTAAAEAERKASYCKLCRKQLTSPAQMKEHLASAPHKERLERVSFSSSVARSNNPNHQRREQRDRTTHPQRQCKRAG